MSLFSNFVVSCSVMIAFGVLIEFDKFSPKSPKENYQDDLTLEL